LREPCEAQLVERVGRTRQGDYGCRVDGAFFGELDVPNAFSASVTLAVWNYPALHFKEKV
jgi:hypothetical protein